MVQSDYLLQNSPVVFDIACFLSVGITFLTTQFEPEHSKCEAGFMISFNVKSFVETQRRSSSMIQSFLDT